MSHANPQNVVGTDHRQWRICTGPLVKNAILKAEPKFTGGDVEVTFL